MAIRPELRSELLSLSAEDRHELADELYESLIAEPLDPAWTQEIEQRVEDIAAGRVELIDADEVHAELRAELRDSRR
jgi:putative addiction module component (TIGR02574 family)